MSSPAEQWPVEGKVWVSDDLVIGFASPAGALQIETTSPVDALTIFQGNCKAMTGYTGDRPHSVEIDSGDMTFTERGAELYTATDHFPEFIYVSSPTGFHKKLVGELSGVGRLRDTSTRAQKLQHRAELSRMLMQFIESDGFGGRLKAEALTCLIVTEMLQATDKTIAKKPKGGLGRHAVRKIKEFVHEHCDEEMSLDRLAELAGVSSFHFARMFKQDTGVSPHQYVIQSRIQRARGLLLGKNANIAEIAYRTGFSSQSHMTECFKRVVGTTPARYRQIARR